MTRTLVFLPTYNEKENIELVVREVLAAAPGVEALVVDDNSPDGTAAIAEKLAAEDPRIHVMVRKTDRGRGRAGADAIRWFQEREYDVFIEMDADGSHPAKYIPGVISEIEGGADITVCSRLVPGGGERNRSFVRRWLTLASNMFIRFVLGLRIRDCTTGYRGFSNKAIAAIVPGSLFTPGPAIVQELLYILTKKGFKAVEIPFMFEQRAAGRSKLKLSTLLLSLQNVWKIRSVHSRNV